MVVPLVRELQKRGLSVWLDKMIMQIGDSITGKIDEGLANSRFGVVIVSPAFLRKNWPKRELDALAARETEANEVVILPVWHEITYDQVFAYSPTLASKFAASTSNGIKAVAEQIEIRCKRSSVAPSIPKQPTNRLGHIPALVRQCLLEPPQPSSLQVIPLGEVWQEYRELNTLGQDEDLIAIWKFERFSLFSTPSHFAFTSQGLRIFECNMFTNRPKSRLFIPYKDFPEYEFAAKITPDYHREQDANTYTLSIDGPQEWRRGLLGRWGRAVLLIGLDLNHIRDMITEQ